MLPLGQLANAYVEGPLTRSATRRAKRKAEESRDSRIGMWGSATDDRADWVGVGADKVYTGDRVRTPLRVPRDADPQIASTMPQDVVVRNRRRPNPLEAFHHGVDVTMPWRAATKIPRSATDYLTFGRALPMVSDLVGGLTGLDYPVRVTRRAEDKLIEDIERAPTRQNPRKTLAGGADRYLSMKAIAGVQAQQLASVRGRHRRSLNPSYDEELDRGALVNSVMLMVTHATPVTPGRASLHVNTDVDELSAALGNLRLGRQRKKKVRKT